MLTRFDLPAAARDALDLVDAADLAALTTELVRIPSVTGSDAESAAQHHLARLMNEIGLEVDLWEIDLAATTADPGFPGLEAPRTEAWGLVGTTGPESGDGPTVVLNSHIDVVPAGHRANWDVDPFAGEIRDGLVTGRGTCDMKAGLACQLTALRLLRAAGARLPRVALHSVVGEEDGGLGTFATLRRGHRGDLAVICEPTSLALVPAAAGALTFRLTVAGRAAHASMRTTGVDAIEKYLLVHTALRELEARRNASPSPLFARYDIAYPLSVGTLRAGDWPSTVPEEVIAEGRLGVALGEPPGRARADLEEAVAQVCARDGWLRDHPVTVEWFGGQFASAEVATDAAPARLVADAHALVTGTAPEVYGVPYGSDMRLLTDVGDVPAVHYGPGDVALAHGPRESVPISDLVTVTRTLVTLLAMTA